jgi:hypothetical protein
MLNKKNKGKEMKTSLNESVDSRNPQAWIAIQKNRQKIYGTSGKSEVYLSDGQEFQIELFNPTQTRFLVKFKFNGLLTSERGLILNPGQRYFLDRFIDENSKLTFSTYEVENSRKAKKAIEKNGLLEIQFYAESVPFSGSGLIWSRNSSYNTFNGIANSGTTVNYSNHTLTSENLVGTLVNTFSSYCADLNTSVQNKDASLETGRVERGERSNQTFENGYGNFNSWTSCSTVIQILPKSRKPAEVHEIRNYCVGCGIRIKKQSWKFCPNCGTKF